MKTLFVVFSYKYPYEPPTEQFLHMEMPYLDCDNVDICIVPYARNRHADKTYPISDRIQVKPLKRKRLSDILLGVWGTMSRLGSIFRELQEIKKSVSPTKRRAAQKTMLRQCIQAQMFRLRLKKHLKTSELKEYDKVVLYTYWLDSMSLAITEYKHYLKKKGIGSVVAISRTHGQGDLYIEEIPEAYRPFGRLLANGLDRIFSISEQGMVHLRERDITNVSICRLGVETSKQISAEKNDEVPLIVSCSVVNENKRVGEIAKAISKLSLPQIKWVHFGGGEKLDELRTWCESNMPTSVSWELRGWTAHDDVMQYYAEHSPDAFINLSCVEGIPVSIMEAMSYAIPCIATDVGASAEIVMDGKNGYLVPREFEITDVVTALTRLITEEHKKTKECAYNTWCDLYNAKNNFESFAAEALQL